MSMRKLFGVLLPLWLASCGVQKQAVPEWISGKPVDPSHTYAYGLGSAFINPNVPYQMTARQQALSDLAQELSSEIYDETRIRTMEDAMGYRSTYQSNTQMSTTVQLDNYQPVETYADQDRYYVLYRLDIAAYRAEKERADLEAYEWVQQTVTEATKAPNLTMADRVRKLGEAFKRADEQHLFWSTQYSSPTSQTLLDGLRDLEKALAVDWIQSEQTAYLGLPKTFAARMGVRSDLGSAAGFPFHLHSSSGHFQWMEPGTQVVCLRTGEQNNVQFRISWNWDALLPHLEPAQRQWFMTSSSWNQLVDVYFAKTELNLVGPEMLTDALLPSLSKSFEVSEQAPLTLELRSKSYTVEGRGTFQHIISGSYVLKAGESVLWSSEAMDSKATSSSQERAMDAAVNQFSEDFALFLLPQIRRTLGY